VIKYSICSIFILRLKMFIVNIEYTAPLDVIDQHLLAHRDFLETYYKKGVLLASGPKNPRIEGGILIALGNDRALIEAMTKEDPFFQAGVAHYSITEFTAVKHRSEIQHLL
jgi:uncharacterized protein YciI